MMRTAIPLLLALSTITACKGGGSTNPGDDDDMVDASTTPDGPPIPDGWTELIGRSWTVPVNSADTYRCRRIQVTQDMWVSGFQAQAATGTHHTVVTISNSGQTGDYNCSAGSLDMSMLYASGVGTDELAFPTGVAIKIKSGQFINLNLHLFNASDTEIAGNTSILVKQVAAADVVHEADMTFAGSLRFTIPPGDNQEVKGGCTLGSDWHIFTLWPHMHQYAKHQQLQVTRPNQQPETLLDDNYDFTDQKNYPMTEMTLPTGTRVDVTCLYNNDTNPAQDLHFGDSSNDEMCFTGIYKWPAGGNLFQCSF